MRKSVHFRKLKFKIFRGSMPPDPPSALAPAALDTIFAGLTLNCSRRACYYQWVILSIILRILRTQNYVSFLSRVHLPYYKRYIYILGTANMRLAQASSATPSPPPPPPRRKSCVRAWSFFFLQGPRFSRVF